MIISFGQLQLTNNKVGGKSPKRAFMLLFCRRQPAVELNFSDWASKTQSWIDVLPQFLKLAVNIKYMKHQVFFRNEGNIPEALKKIQAVANARRKRYVSQQICLSLWIGKEKRKLGDSSSFTTSAKLPGSFYKFFPEKFSMKNKSGNIPAFYICFLTTSHALSISTTISLPKISTA